MAPAFAAALLAGAAASRGKRRTQRTAMAARWFFGRRKPSLRRELKEELKEEKAAGKELRECMEEETQAAEATLKTLTSQLAELREQEQQLRKKLRDAQEEEKAASTKLDDLKDQIKKEGRPNWKAVIEQQTLMLEKILEVAERLEKREKQLREDLAARREHNAQLQADLQAAAELSKEE